LPRIVVKDIEACERFLKQKLTRLEGAASIDSSFALGQVKHAPDLNPIGAPSVAAAPK
jgi:Lrp/AsnC family leucine-responsive transcriptional regulator